MKWSIGKQFILGKLVSPLRLHLALLKERAGRADLAGRRRRRVVVQSAN